jgi:tetratricopeptide (TPR) repeat protein
LGDCLRKQQRYKEAIDKFKDAIKIDSKSYASYGAMGDCFRELSLYDKAEGQYKKAIEINNEYEDAYSAWGACLHKQERYEEAIEKFKQAIEINPESEYNPWFWAICLKKLKSYDEAIKIFEKYLPGSEDIDVIYSYGDCLMGAKRYSAALKQFERLINIQPEYYQVYLPYGQLLEKKQDKELALLAYLKHISFGSMALSGNFDFQKIHNEHILPLLKVLKPGKYIKQFYAPENDKKFPEPILSIFLILLAKYDTVSENIQDIVKTYLEKDDEEINDFNLFIFTIKLSIWLKLCEGNLSDGLRLVDLYIEYIKSLKSAKKKENEVSNFSMGLFRVQINLGIDPQNTKKILSCLKSADDVPFSDVLLKIWTCISEPDSVDAQRYLSDKAIADVVMELRADDSTSKT